MEAGIHSEHPSDRERLKFAVDGAIKACRLCDGLNVRGLTESAPGYGWLYSPVVIVGQSLCGEPCISSQIPFTDGCGDELDKAFKQAGIAKHQAFLTNVVHCHPRDNVRSKAEWKTNCRPYLQLELSIVKPKLVIGLGKDAEETLGQLYSRSFASRKLDWPFQEPRIIRPEHFPYLLFAPHPSRLSQLRRDELVASVARGLRWGFRGVPEGDRPQRPPW